MLLHKLYNVYNYGICEQFEPNPKVLDHSQPEFSKGPGGPDQKLVFNEYLLKAATQCIITLYINMAIAVIFKLFSSHFDLHHDDLPNQFGPPIYLPRKTGENLTTLLTALSLIYYAQRSSVGNLHLTKLFIRSKRTYLSLTTFSSSNQLIG